MANLTTYDPDDVSAVFAGIPIAGYADGTFVEIEQDEDDFSLTVGSDGEACRAKTNNRAASMTVTLLQSSATNDLLSAKRNADILTPSGDGIGAFMVKDNSGTTVCNAQKAWIVKPPAVVYSRGVEARAWTFKTDSMDWFVGGN